VRANFDFLTFDLRESCVEIRSCYQMRLSSYDEHTWTRRWTPDHDLGIP